MSLYRVNFQYKGKENALRAGALVITGETKDAAVKIAAQQLEPKYEWAEITTVIPLPPGIQMGGAPIPLSPGDYPIPPAADKKHK